MHVWSQKSWRLRVTVVSLAVTAFALLTLSVLLGPFAIESPSTGTTSSSPGSSGLTPLTSWSFSVNPATTSGSVSQTGAYKLSGSTNLVSGTPSKVTCSPGPLPNGYGGQVNYPVSCTGTPTYSWQISFVPTTNTAPGSYTFSFSFTASGAASQGFYFYLTVTAASWSFSVNPASTSGSVSQTGAYMLDGSTTVTSGSAQSVTCTPGNLPNGYGGSVNYPQSCSGTPNYDWEISFVPTTNTPTGTYEFSFSFTASNAPSQGFDFYLTVTQATYSVSISSSPSGCPVSFDGTGYPEGGTVTGVNAGSYPVVAAACSGLTFVGWTGTAGDFGSGSSYSTTVDVSASGSIVANYASPSSPAIQSFTASPGTITIGQSTQLTVSATGGSPPYTYTYSNLPAGCVEEDVDSFSCTPSESGSFQVYVEVQDLYGLAAGNSTSLVISPSSGALTVSSFTASPNSLTVGQSTGLSVTPSGGVSPYYYSYTGLPPGTCLQTTTASPTCTPSAAGTFTIEVWLSDSLGDLAQGTLLLTVTPASATNAPTLDGFFISPAESTVESAITLSFESSGWISAPQYSYTGLPIGCSTEDASVFSCVPSAAGTYAVTAVATDPEDQQLTAVSTVVVTTASSPEVTSFTASPSIVTEGQSIQFSVTVNGGVAPYTYSYAIYNNAGATTGNSCLPTAWPVPSSFTCQTSGWLGVFRLSVFVTDWNHESAPVATVSFTVNAPTSSWSSDPNFSVTTIDVSAANFCSGSILNLVEDEFCATFTAAFNGDPTAGGTIYLVVPSSFSSAGLSAYASDLNTYFAIAPNSKYTPVFTLILHVPVLQDANDLFGTDFPTYLGTPVESSLFSGSAPAGIDPTLALTPTGALDIAFTISLANPFSSANSLQQLGQDSTTLLADSLGVILKGGDPVTLINDLSDGMKVFLDFADITVTDFTSDLSQSGPISGFQFFDMYQFYDGQWTQVAIDLLQQLSLVLTCAEAGGSGGADVFADVQCPLTALDDAVNFLPKALPGWDLSSNTLYNWIQTGLGAITSTIDPPGATVLPTVLNQTRQVVLGYDAENDSFVSLSSFGMLLATGDGFEFFLNASGIFGNSTLELTEVGNLSGGESIPYSTQLYSGSSNGDSFAASVSGVLFNDTSVEIPLTVSAGPTLSLDSYLSPTNLVSSNGDGGFDVILNATENNGTSVVPTSCSIELNNTSVPLEVRGTQCVGSVNSTAANTVLTSYIFAPPLGGGYQSLVFPESTYAAQFVESGLPASANWYVNLSSGPTLTGLGSDPDLVVDLADGAYEYATSTNDPSYAPIVYSASFSIMGAPASFPISFSLVTYVVTFAESGLPSGDDWSVSVVGEPSITASGSQTSQSANLPNGTYAFTVSTDNLSYAPSYYSNTFAVDGAPVVVVPVTFSLVTYSVEFSESGLSAGLNWTVEFNGTNRSLLTDGGTDTLGFPAEPNGSYAYSIIETAGWGQSSIPYTGLVTIYGVPFYTNVVYSVSLYTVSFVESGLPSGTDWTVTLSGLSLSSTATKIAFQEPNGTYSYKVGTVPGYHTSGRGSLTVSGSSPKVKVEFKLSTYKVKFTESGLASGTQWCVTFDGTSYCTTGKSITISDVVNGSYLYSIGSVPGYTLKGASSGTVVVAGRSPGTVSNTIRIVWKRA